MTTMESALEVLSRAASMVETSDARDAALKRTLDEDVADLPPKYKYRHLSVNPQTNDAFSADDQNHNRRCAGTQTAFSSFPHDVYSAQRASDYKILDLDRLSSARTVDHVPGRHLHIPPMVSSRPTVPIARSSPTPPAATARTPPPPPPTSPPEDASAAPLNLTTSVTSQQQHYQQQHQGQQKGQQQQLRPSVITMVSSPFCGQQRPGSGHGSPPGRVSPARHSPPRHSPSHHSSPRHSPSRPSQPISSSRVSPDSEARLFILPSDPCGTSIDEHFRRSLGQNYPAVYGSAPASPLTPSASPARSRSPPSPTPAPPVYQHPDPSPAEQPKNNVSIAGTVDDHFAKSLGDKWKQINPPKQQQAAAIPAGSVDDHFAKALGETWLRIKAEKERPDGSKPGSPVSDK